MRRHALVVSFSLIILLFAGCTVYTMGPAMGPPPGAPPPGPPVVTMNEPQFLYFMPSWGIYFVPGVSMEIFYYNGLWYYQARGTWYWGQSYRGPWAFMSFERVPRVLRKLPPDYRAQYRRPHYRVPYGHWQKRWNEPPPTTKYKPPGFLYKVPKTGAYAYPNVPDEIFRYKDRWFKRYKGTWYWSWNYNGPWAYSNPDRVPKKLKDTEPYPYWKDQKKYKTVPWK